MKCRFLPLILITNRRVLKIPRIVKIEDLYYLTYTAYDGVNAHGALATSKDLLHFERKGLIVPRMTFDEFKRLAECSGQVNKKYFRHIRHIKRNKKIFLWDKNVIFFPAKNQRQAMFPASHQAGNTAGCCG
jgi:hypothetical protein